MSVGVIFFIGSTFLSADTVLIDVETSLAITVSSIGVVLGVDGAGHAVSVADEVVSGAFLTDVAHQAVPFKTDTLVGLSAVDGVLTTNEHTFAGS